MGIFAHWWPVTYDFGLIRADIDAVAAAYVRMYEDAGVKHPTTWVSGLPEDCFALLEPLSYPPRKELFLATAFGWTGYLRNSTRGSDPSFPMYKLSGAFGVTALRACVTPPGALYQGVILEVYDTPQAGGDTYGYRRSIAAMNDGGRWVFEQSGAPFAFEDTARYDARKKRDRFTSEMLLSYLACLGIPHLSDETLQPNGSCRGMLLAHPPIEGSPQYTLEEAKALDHFHRRKA